MPVEQLRGERLSPSTDLYAVGLVLYEMLLAKPAFDGDSAVDIALTVMRGQTLKVPEDSMLPPALTAIIEKASAREPEDRYQSAREMLEAINELDPSLLDVDGAEKERFDKAPTLESVDPDASRSVVASRRALSDDDDVAASTQAISTDDVLAAALPTLRRELRRAAAGPARGAHRRARDPRLLQPGRISRGGPAPATGPPSTWGARGDGARQLRLGGASGEVARQQPGDSRARP